METYITGISYLNTYCTDYEMIILPSLRFLRPNYLSPFNTHIIELGTISNMYTEFAAVRTAGPWWCKARLKAGRIGHTCYTLRRDPKVRIEAAGVNNSRRVCHAVVAPERRCREHGLTAHQRLHCPACQLATTS